MICPIPLRVLLLLLLLLQGRGIAVQAFEGPILSRPLNDTTRSDTLRLRKLRQVTIYNTSGHVLIPGQQLAGKPLKSLSSLSVADAIRYFSGMQVKDYGGVGGLKTVDMRSMGTHHIGVFYDGIALGNAQNGQIDLGKFSMDNIESITVYNGQKSAIFQPAKDYGASGTLYLRSRRPAFDSLQNIHLKAAIKMGSFGLFNPSILWEQRLRPHTDLSVSGEYTGATGRYPFRYKRVFPGSKTAAYDTTAIRQNGDIGAFRVESGLYGQLPAGGTWQAKAYYYQSERGIPGAIVNNVWKNAQRQWDRNFFVQAAFQQQLGKNEKLQINAKYAYDYMRYLNPDTTLLHIDNRFYQQEAYISAANLYQFAKNIQVNVSTDVQYNALRSDMAGFVFPKRLTGLLALAGAASFGKLQIQASALGSFIREKQDNGNTNAGDAKAAAPGRNILTPALFITYQPFKSPDFSLNAFYKHIFRMPTFNDLYYTDIGNIALKPEYTRQYNIGFTYQPSLPEAGFFHWQLKADAYRNNVDDKIVAVPKGSGMYRWMMMNLGTVHIKGLDLSSDLHLSLNDETRLNMRLSYTYQRAKDLTRRQNPDLEKLTYGGQIPYIPWHSGSFIAGIERAAWRLQYSFIYVGKRYQNSANIPENYEQPWYTSDVSASRTLALRGGQIRLSAELNNLFNQDYEVVLNYPMPKRNYKFLLSWEW